ncbi:MAG: TIM barrel protein [Butyricicoccus sp.]
MCFDTGHHVYGGGEPISFYKKWAKRIPYIHFKDCDLAVKAKMDENKWSFAKAVTEDIMVEPGKGSIDFTAMHKALDECGYDGWCVVEQDLFPVKSFDVPLEKASIGRENLRKAGF